MRNFDSKFSLTGDEFLDFLSWCDVMEIDFEGKEKKKENIEENQKNYNEENNHKLIYRKERKR